MTTSLLALFEEARADLAPSAAQIAIGRARLRATLAAPASGAPVALGAAGLAGGLVAILFAFATGRSDVSAGTPPTAAPVTSPLPAAVVTPLVPPAEAPAIAPAPVVPTPVARPRRPRAVTPAPEDALAHELRLLRDARAAITAGAFDRAHAALDEHARAFPEAQLAQEAALLDIELSCASGDVSGARTAAIQFVERWPRSSKRARAERACPTETEEVTDAP